MNFTAKAQNAALSLVGALFVAAIFVGSAVGPAVHTVA